MVFKNVGQFCRYFRSEVLNLTLEEMSKKVNVKNSTLSSFENGRSTNLGHIHKYYNCGDGKQREFFRENIPL